MMAITRRMPAGAPCRITFALSGAPPRTQTKAALLIGASALERAVRGHHIVYRRPRSGRLIPSSARPLPFPLPRRRHSVKIAPTAVLSGAAFLRESPCQSLRELVSRFLIRDGAHNEVALAQCSGVATDTLGALEQERHQNCCG